jgi:tetratricopeptide (TPR) repeat protein
MDQDSTKIPSEPTKGQKPSAMIPVVLLMLVLGLALGADKLGLSSKVNSSQAWIETVNRRNTEMTQANLKKALEEFEDAKLHKSQNLPKYCINLLVLAGAYRSNNEHAKADSLFEEAMALYKQSPAIAEESPNIHSFLWNYVRHFSTPENFDARFTELLQVGEHNKSVETTEMDREILTTLGTIGRNTRWHLNVKKAWQKVIDIRASVRGRNDSSLALPIRHYADACEAAGDIDESEKAQLRAMALEPKTDVTNATIWQVQLGEFYLRHDMPEKADAAWHKAERMAHEGINEWEAREFVDLAEHYRKAGRTEDMEKVITAMLADGGNDVMKAFDPKIDDLVSGYISSGSLARAENLLKKRVEASSTCTADADSKDWRIKLSDLYLAMGRIDESNKLYQQVLASEALMAQPTESIRSHRATLLAQLGHTEESRAIKATLPVPVTGPIKIEYGLLAMEEIRLGAGAQVDSYDSSERNGLRAMGVGPGHSEGSVCCLGTTRQDGQIRLNGTIYGKVVPPLQETPVNPIFAAHARPAPRIVTPFPQPLKPPQSGTSKWPPNYGPPGGGGAQTLCPGDYISSQFPPLTYGTIVLGRTRFFLEDEADIPRVLEVHPIGIGTNRPIDFQIWYKGNRKLRLRNVQAVVYAPNATVELPFNCTFAGRDCGQSNCGRGQ